MYEIYILPLPERGHHSFFFFLYVLEISYFVSWSLYQLKNPTVRVYETAFMWKYVIQ